MQRRGPVKLLEVFYLLAIQKKQTTADPWNSGLWSAYVRCPPVCPDKITYWAAWISVARSNTEHPFPLEFQILKSE